MAGGQRRFWNWRDDDLTADINQWLQGLIDSGRYRGFDAVLDATMLLKLNHSATGAVRVNQDAVWTDKFGVVSTKQGTIIQEYENLEFAVDNTAVNMHRIDLIVVTHDYEQVVGGEQALYSLIKGTEVSTDELAEAPLLPNEETQTILGELYLPSNTSSLTNLGVIYTPAAQPNFANHVAFIEKEDGFFITDLDGRDNKIINLKNPTEPQDAATKYYVDQAILNNIVWATEAVRGIAKLAAESDVIGAIVNAEIPNHTKIVTLRRLIQAYFLYRASQTEANTDTNDIKFITPKTLANRTATETRKGVARIATLAEAEAGIDDTTIITPFKLKKALPIYPIILEIGEWSITGAAPYSKTLAHGLAAKWNKVVAMDAMIVQDDLAVRATPSIAGIKIDASDVTVTLDAVDGDYDATGQNRGYVTFWIQETLVATNILIVNAGVDEIVSFVEGDGLVSNFNLSGFVEALGSSLDTLLWECTVQPAGSTVVIADDDNLATAVTADKYGAYTFKLTATNTDTNTAFDTVVVTLTENVNTPPVINYLLAQETATQDPSYVHPEGLVALDGWKRAGLSVNATDEDGDTLTYSIVRVDNYNPLTEEIGNVIANGDVVFEQTAPTSNTINIRGLSINGGSANAGNGATYYFFKVTVSDGNGGEAVKGYRVKAEPSDGGTNEFNMSVSNDTNGQNLVMEANLLLNPVSEVSSLKVTITSNFIPAGNFAVALQIGAGGGQFMSLGTTTINPTLVASSIPFRFEIADTEPNGEAVATFKAYDSSNNLLDQHSIIITI